MRLRTANNHRRANEAKDRQRKRIAKKVIRFGLVYGTSPQRAAEMVQQYRMTYPQVVDAFRTIGKSLERLSRGMREAKVSIESLDFSKIEGRIMEHPQVKARIERDLIRHRTLTGRFPGREPLMHQMPRTKK